MDSRASESSSSPDHRAGQQESAFHLSLRQLRSHLDDMNERTTLLLQDAREQMHREMCGDSLSLPNGPAFWQLYQALRSDLRGLDARVELVEDRLQSLSDRLDALEPVKLTPPGSPAVDGGIDYADALHSDHRHRSANDDNSQSSDTVTKHPSCNVPLADIAEVGYLDADCKDELPDPAATSDVFTFMARLRRVSLTGRVIDVESSLRGSALQMYRLGYRSDGTNVYEESNGRIKLDALEQMLLTLYKPDAANTMKNDTYTIGRTNAGRSLRDWAIKMLFTGRYLETSDEIERQALTFDFIRDGIRGSTIAPVWQSAADRPKTILDLMERLRRYELAIKESRATHDRKPSS